MMTIATPLIPLLHTLADASRGGWGFRAASASWLLPLLLIAAVALAVWLYRGSSLAHGWRTALAVVRGLVLAIVLAMLFQPVWVLQASNQIRQHVLVLLDVSESMELRDQRQHDLEWAEAHLATAPGDHRHADLQATLAKAMLALDGAGKALSAGRFTEGDDLLKQWALRLEDITAHVRASGAAGGGIPDAALHDWQARTRQMQQQMREGIDAKVPPPAEYWTELGRLAHEVRDQVDTSITVAGRHALASISPPPRSNMPSRIELAKALLADERRTVFDDLESQHTVRYFSFGETVRPQGVEQAAPRRAVLALDANEKQTQLGTAMDEAVAQHAGRALGAIVVLSDGGSNAGLDPLVVAEQLGRRGVRVFPVGLGLPDPPDIAIERIISPPLAFVRDRVPLQVQLRSSGYAGRSVTVTARLDGNTLAEEIITLGGGLQWMELPIEPQLANSEAVLEVSVSELPDEVSYANNRQRQPLRVTDQRINVLYIEGKPRWEFRYLRQILLRDHRLNVRLLMTEGDRDLSTVSDVHLGSLPSDPEALFKYDLIILGDVPASYFRQEQMQMVATLVRERGGSLLMIAGQEHAPRTYAGSPLEPVLPVRPGTSEMIEVEDSAVIGITPAGAYSAITRLLPDLEQNLRVWQRVQPLLRLPQIDEIKPGAVTLAALNQTALHVGDDPYPIVSWHRYGVGRGMLVATDSLWRLRFRHGDAYHARFWGQVIQFLTLARMMGDANRVQIATNAPEYRSGQRVHVSVNVLTESYQPLEADEYVIELQQVEPQAQRTVLTLRASAAAPGLFEGSFTAEPGQFRLNDPSQPGLTTNVGFRVTEVPLELIEPAMQESLLRELAQRSGGRYTPVAELPTLPAMLEAPPQTIVSRHERDLWNQPWLLALLVALLGAEWFIRRRMQQL
jgi:hypothetical protein